MFARVPGYTRREDSLIAGPDPTLAFRTTSCPGRFHLLLKSHARLGECRPRVQPRRPLYGSPTIRSEQIGSPSNAGAFLPDCWIEGLFSPVSLNTERRAGTDHQIPNGYG